ncbi:MAG: 2'-5' RNA ligase family protein [Anaerolineae bacterium]|nr:2'-5' RNA ligase family protein [Anaerolineae bacterium]
MASSNLTQAAYDRIESEGRAQMATGRIRTDPHLLDRASDTRRGLTLILRPDEVTLAQLAALLDDLRGVIPGQHVYRPGELHITVLPVISASPGLTLDEIPVNLYRAIFAPVIESTAPFAMRITGLIGTPNAVLLAGYADSHADGDRNSDPLNALRDRLRAALNAAGLAGLSERRYPSVTAHLTVARYQSQPRDLPALAAWLADHRDRTFGAFRAETVDLVFNNWYMDQDLVQTLAHFPLKEC